MTAKFSRTHWLIFIVNKWTDTWIYNLCINDMILLASYWSVWHFCLTFFSYFDLILSPLPFCYCKKQIDVSFSCICPVIDNEFHHNIICHSSLQIHSAMASWIHSYFDIVMTKFMINNRTDAWKTDINLLILTLKIRFVSCLVFHIVAAIKCL
mgnify:CR=1 FL=1